MGKAEKSPDLHCRTPSGSETGSIRYSGSREGGAERHLKVFLSATDQPGKVPLQRKQKKKAFFFFFALGEIKQKKTNTKHK